MIWLEKDLELMMRLIHADIGDFAKSHAEAGTDAVLKTEADDLKVNVAQGMQHQISNFHVRVEEVLKENQRLLKSKLPLKVDRCY